MTCGDRRIRGCAQVAAANGGSYIIRMRFLCDEMVVGLGRWLRAAGYDTSQPERGASDRLVVEQAIAEDRKILTRDGAIGARRLAAGRVFALRGDRLEEWAAQLTPALGVDWLRRPFSRCLSCNTELLPHPHEPPRLLGLGVDGALMHCPSCDKIYWRGGHTRRMHERLSRWRAGRFI